MSKIDQHYEAVKGIIRNRERVKDLAEVFTPPHIVSMMIDLLPEDAQSPESTYLEPSCGNGNFLVEILARKVRALELRGESELGHSYELVAALATITGIDISAENVKEARNRLWSHAFGWHVYLTGLEPSQGWATRVLGVLSLKIVEGDFLKGNFEVHDVKVMPWGQIISRPQLLSDMIPHEEREAATKKKKKARKKAEKA